MKGVLEGKRINGTNKSDSRRETGRKSVLLRKASLLFRETRPPGSMMCKPSFFERKSRAAVFMRPAALGGLS